jgi:adenylate cyclase
MARNATVAAVDEAEIEAAGLLEGLDGDHARSERIELVQLLAAEGFSLDELREAAASDRLALLPVDRVLRRDDVRHTAEDLAAQTGLDLAFLRRLWRSLGLADAPDDELAYTDADLEAARTVATFREAGLDDDTLVLIAQVLGHGMTRLAETIREIVGDLLLQAGDSERTVGRRYAEATEQLVPQLNPLLGYVFAVQLREQVKTDVVTQTELATGSVAGARHVTVCFADLVGFTRLGERVAPPELAAAARRLTELAVEVARPPVKLVKTIGDAALLVSPEEGPLLDAALELLARVEEDPEKMPTVRIGVASGDAVAHGGDWFGAPVNLASRVAGVARPGSVLATKAVREAADDGYAWSAAGTHKLKGIKGPVSLHRAR